jgi:hypothetical protein
MSEIPLSGNWGASQKEHHCCLFDFEGADFDFLIDKTSLVSKGEGSNQGVEFTPRKFFIKVM